MTDNPRGSLWIMAAAAGFPVGDLFAKSAAASLPVDRVVMIFGTGGMIGLAV